MTRRCRGKWYANQLLVQYCGDRVVLWTSYDDPYCEAEPSCFYAELGVEEVAALVADLIEWLREEERDEQGQR